MRWTARRLWPGAVVLAAGCANLATPTFSTPQAIPAELPATVRALPVLDATELPAATTPAPPANYYQLTADHCRDLAYRNSSLANLIESSTLVHTGYCATSQSQTCADLLRYNTATHLSLEARNRTAGAALTLYYRILELELKADVLTNSLTELDALVKTLDTLKDKGFKLPANAYELKKQRIELLGEQAKLQSGLAKLNTELKALLAVDPNVPGFLLPADAVKVSPDPLDADAAVQVGLARRADLNLLRTLQASTDHATVPAVRAVLMGLTPVLGAVMPLPQRAYLMPYVAGLAKAEACHLRNQLAAVLKDREREAIKEIRTAVGDWATARDLVVISKQKFALAQDQQLDLEKREKLGQNVDVELRLARLEAYKLEAEVIADVVKWKLADVKAREALGLLCGE